MTRILVELKDVITFPVTQIMKLSFATGVIPDDWKIALVSPIYKNGPKCQVSNYRPISLTSIICKLFESIVRDALVQHLENNGLIRGTQHGFRRGGSCLSNLLQFLDRVTSEIDNGECVDVVYLDFAKAFDKVPHKRLMAKLVTVLVNSLVGVARAQHASVIYLINGILLLTLHGVRSQQQNGFAAKPAHTRCVETNWWKCSRQLEAL